MPKQHPERPAGAATPGRVAPTLALFSDVGRSAGASVKPAAGAPLGNTSPASHLDNIGACGPHVTAPKVAKELWRESASIANPVLTPVEHSLRGTCMWALLSCAQRMRYL
jgi:hypothetical protein